MIAVNLNTGVTTRRRKVPVPKEAKRVTREEAEAVGQALWRPRLCQRTPPQKTAFL